MIKVGSYLKGFVQEQRCEIFDRLAGERGRYDSTKFTMFVSLCDENAVAPRACEGVNVVLALDTIATYRLQSVYQESDEFAMVSGICPRPCLTCSTYQSEHI